MAKGATIVLYNASAAGSNPGTLQQGELAIDALASPPHIWTGVPTSRDPSGRIDLLSLSQLGLGNPVPIASGGTNATSGNAAFDSLTGVSGNTAGWLNRNAAGQWVLSTPSALFAPLNNPTNGTNNYAPLASPSFSGTVTLPGNATTGLQAVPLQQLNSAVAPYIAKNVVDNPMFGYNGHGAVSGTPLGAGVYGFDRWKGGPAAGCTLTFTSPISGTTAVTITAGSVQQVIEAANLLGGVTYTLSWLGTATGRISTTSGGGTYAASPVQFVGVANTVTYIEFTGGTLGQVQLQMGTVATPFQPDPTVVSRLRCERHFFVFSGNIGGYFPGATTWTSGWISFVTWMRIVPTITLQLSGGTNVNTATVGSPASGGFVFNVQTAAAGVWGFGFTATCSADM